MCCNMPSSSTLQPSASGSCQHMMTFPGGAQLGLASCRDTPPPHLQQYHCFLLLSNTCTYPDTSESRHVVKQALGPLMFFTCIKYSSVLPASDALFLQSAESGWCHWRVMVIWRHEANYRNLLTGDVQTTACPTKWWVPVAAPEDKNLQNDPEE